MKVEEFLREQGIGFEKHHHPVTYTAQGLANAEHVSGYLVAKPVVVKGEAGYAMCVVPAPEHLSLDRVAEVLNEKGVRLASEQEMSRLFPDCELGAEPPIGSLFGMTTLMDQELEEDDYIVMQAGTHTEAIEMRVDDYERVCKPVVAHISTL